MPRDDEITWGYDVHSLRDWLELSLEDMRVVGLARRTDPLSQRKLSL